MKTCKRWLIAVMMMLTALVLSCQPAIKVQAAGDYTLIIEDDADLLTDEEEAQLAQVMEPITAYGHVMFKTISEPIHQETARFAKSYYHQKFGDDSGTLFVIDMDNRMLYIFSDGAIYKTITKSKAETITDNVFRMARAEDYYGCAASTFEQIGKLLNGDKIAQPMKYASNAVLAIILALLINFIIIKTVSMAKPASDRQLLKLAEVHFEGRPSPPIYRYETKIYNPSSSDSGGSSGGSSGGGGGGGSSGGGGGHGF